MTHVPTGCGQLLLLLAAAVSVDSETLPCVTHECPNFITIRHYEQLGCRRSDDSDGCCPTRFNCSSLLSLEKTKCHFRGRTYEPGTHIPQEIKNECTTDCECIDDVEGTSNGEARFNCTIVKCPDFSIVHVGSHMTHSLDQCCSTGEYSGNPNKDYQKVAECTYNGERYFEGEYIEVPGCQTCICQAGFNGTLDGPWCRKLSCDYTIRKTPSELAACAPVYWRYSRCCPINWHCPSPDDIVVRHSEPQTEDDEQCSFGEHRLKIGDKVRTTTGNCIECKCEIPPFVTCTLISFPKCR